MNTLYLLDTDIVSYLIKGRDRSLENRFRSTHPSRVCISSVACAELEYGLRGLPSSNPLQADVPFFLKAIRILPWSKECVGFYADIRHQLTTTGRIIGQLDMMIAAHALALDAVLVTNNTRHYERIPLPLKIENWAKP